MSWLPIENQVCTPKQAKRLKELGVIVHSYFVWSFSEKENWLYARYDLEEKDLQNPINQDQWAPAYTGMELGCLLPSEIKPRHECGERSFITYKTGSWVVAGYEYETEYLTKKFGADTAVSGLEKHEAWARATCLIKLLEEGYLTPQQINKRLKDD